MPKPEVGELRHLDDGVYRVIEVGELMVYRDVSKNRRPRFEPVHTGYWTRCERVDDPQGAAARALRKGEPRRG